MRNELGKKRWRKHLGLRGRPLTESIPDTQTPN
jgi:hypothetical protein